MKPTICKVDGCDSAGKLYPDGKRRLTRGLCNKHYTNWLRNGDPEKTLFVKDGKSLHPLYKTYEGMYSRCYRTSNRSYKDYGARGIAVCGRWLGENGFKNFCLDMGKRPSATHSLDRINNDLGYSPENCRWATRYEQAANTKHSHKTVGVARKVAKSGYLYWTAYLKVNGKQEQVYCRSEEEAIQRRHELEVKYGLK